MSDEKELPQTPTSLGAALGDIGKKRAEYLMAKYEALWGELAPYVNTSSGVAKLSDLLHEEMRWLSGKDQ